MSEETTPDRTRVLVTGASGFIASHLVQQLLRGGYLVRGTVRSLTNPLKVDPIKKLDEHGQRLELVEADLTNEECWKDAVEGCEYVFHTASPFPANEPRDEQDVIKPAVEGTLNVLRACAGRVKRVVLTSSNVAVGLYTPAKGVTEDRWLDENQPGVTAYGKSKKLAEKAAWDYVATLSGDQKFELATVLPSLVIGPVLTEAGGTSSYTMCRLMSGKDPAVPRVKFSIIDVRDVARAHIAAMTTPEAAGHRHLLVSGTAWFQEMNVVLKEEFGPQGYSPSTRALPYFVAWTLSWFDPAIRQIKSMWNVVVEFDTTRMKEVLKIDDPIPWKQSLVDMAYSLIEAGKIPKKKGYKGRPVTTDTATPDPPATESATGGDQLGGGASTEDGERPEEVAVDPPATQGGMPQQEGGGSMKEGEESGEVTDDPPAAQSDTARHEGGGSMEDGKELEEAMVDASATQGGTLQQEGGGSTEEVGESGAVTLDPPEAQPDTADQQEEGGEGTGPATGDEEGEGPSTTDQETEAVAGDTPEAGQH